MENAGYISSGSTWGSIGHPDGLNACRLKLSTLLFDQLIFNDFSQKSSHAVRLYCGMLTPKDEISDKTEQGLLRCWKSAGELAPPFKLYDPEKPYPWEHAPQALRDATRSTIIDVAGADPIDDTGDSYECHKWGLYMMNDILYWQTHFPTASFIGDDAETRILKAAHSASFAGNTGGSGFPDLDALTWSDILDLRRSPFLESFRQQVLLSPTGENAEAVRERYYAALEKISDQVNPSVSKKWFEFGLTNIPFLPVNPASLYYGAQSIREASTLKSDFGWVFMFREIQRRAKRSKPNAQQKK